MNDQLIVYGDTDSVMYTLQKPHPPEVEAIVLKDILARINSRYAGVVMEADPKAFRFLFVGKKRYAKKLSDADDPSMKNIKARGLAMVRRDTSPLAARLMYETTNVIFTHPNRKTCVDAVAAKIGEILCAGISRADVTTLIKFGKAPDTYAENSQQAQLLRAFKENGGKVVAGDLVSIVPVTMREDKYAKNKRTKSDVAPVYPVQYVLDEDIDANYAVDTALQKVAQLLTPFMDYPTTKIADILATKIGVVGWRISGAKTSTGAIEKYMEVFEEEEAEA